MTESAHRHARRRVRLAALGLVVHQERVLLVAHGYAQRWWGLPGGAVDPGERADACVVREIREETGLRTESDGLVAISDRGELLLLVYGCRLVGDDSMTLRAGEITAARWCRAEDLDELEPAAFSIGVELGRQALASGLAPLSSVVVADPDGAALTVEYSYRVGDR